MKSGEKLPTAEPAAISDLAGLQKTWFLLRDDPAFQTDSAQALGLCNKALALGDLLLAREILNSYSGCIDARHPLARTKAKILVQSGNTESARDLLAGLREAGLATCEDLCLIARTHKDDWLRTLDTSRLHSAIDGYREAYDIVAEKEPGIAAFPAVNAATLLLAARDKTEAEIWARRAIELEPASRADSRQSAWTDVTLGEAYLVLCDLEEARRRYARCAGMSLRDRASARRQARLVLRGLGQSAAEMDSCFALPTIVVFAGHMIDAPGRASRRFPAEMEKAATCQIEKALESVGAGIGYCSAAVGSDILFAEALLRRGGELQVHLSGPKEEFVKRSVAYVRDPAWRERFEKVLEAGRKPLADAPEHQPIDDSLGYVFSSLKLSGMAGMRACSLGLDLVPMAFHDGRAGDGAGGTADFVDFWRTFNADTGGYLPAHQIFVRPLTIRSDKILETTSTDGLDKGQTDANSRTWGWRGTKIQAMQQDIKALLFADVQGFSRLKESSIPSFFKEYMVLLSRMIDRSADRPIVCETWGDAAYMVFDEVGQAGRFALEMKRILSPRFAKEMADGDAEMRRLLQIRIALHAGPVFHVVDPLTRRISFTGRHVSQTARLEPITEPGEVYATESFAALSWALRADGYTCEFLGSRHLAKEYGESLVYRLCPRAPAPPRSTGGS